MKTTVEARWLVTVVVAGRAARSSSKKSMTRREQDHQVAEAHRPLEAGDHGELEDNIAPWRAAVDKAKDVEQQQRNDGERNGGDHGGLPAVADQSYDSTHATKKAGDTAGLR